MPAVSKKQRRAAGAALARKRAGQGLGKGFDAMSIEKLEHYASTSEKRLPTRKKKKK